MQVGDEVTLEHDGKTCRAVINLIIGPVARVNIWDGQKHVTKPVMVRDLKEKEEEE